MSALQMSLMTERAATRRADAERYRLSRAAGDRSRRSDGQGEPWWRRLMGLPGRGAVTAPVRGTVRQPAPRVA